MIARTALIVVAASFLACSILPGQSEQGGDPYRNIISYDWGKSRRDCVAIEAEIRKGGPAQFAQIEEKLLAALQSPEATLAARQFICRQLAIVGSDKSVLVLSRLLSDTNLSDMARYALEPNPSPAAGAALRDALAQAQGKQLIGIISSVGARRDNLAVGALRKLAEHPDAAVAEAALTALGCIGTSEAAAALEQAKVGQSLQMSRAGALLSAARQLAVAGKTSEALAIFRSLAGNEQPRAVRTGATRGLLATLPPAETVKLALQILQGDDSATRAAALAAIQDPSERNLRDALAEHLPGLGPEAQVAALAILNEQSDIALRPSLLKLIQQSTDQEVRKLALQGMGTFGQAADVPLLVSLVAKGGPDAGPARAALERMGSAGVDEALLDLIGKTDAAGRRVIMGVLAARRTQGAVAVLETLIDSTDVGTAIDAARALETLGSAPQLPKLAQLIARADEAELRKAAQSAAAAICSRTADKTACSQAVLPVLEKAQSPAARIALIALLPRIRDNASLAAVRKATSDANPEVKEAAIRTLVDWPDFAAVQDLLELARTSPNATHAILALRGVIRLAGSAVDQPVAQRLSAYRGAMELARRDEERKQALAGLSDLPTAGAADLIEQSLKQPALSTDAALAGIRLARQLGIVDNQRAVTLLQTIRAQVPSDDLKKQVDQAMAAIEKGSLIDGYIVAWALAGPFFQEGKDAAELFNISFPPERAGAAGVVWRPVAAATEGVVGLIALDKALGGDQRCAYLRTQITSRQAQEALLEIGSDDGVKVWINGRLVHANNVIRANTPGQDKVKVNLRQGINTLLLKVTQGGGEWSAMVRLRSAAGGEVSGVTVSAPTER